VRGALARPPAPLLLLREASRLTRRHVLAAVPRDAAGPGADAAPENALTADQWRRLFARARLRIVREDEAAPQSAPPERRFLLERT
jgi:hypothetical protein